MLAGKCLPYIHIERRGLSILQYQLLARNSMMMMKYTLDLLNVHNNVLPVINALS